MRTHPLSWFVAGRKIIVADKMQTYTYTLSVKAGTKLEFSPEISPGRALRMGIFEGKYLNDCTGEFPREWYERAKRAGKLSPEAANPEINAFKVKSRLSLQEWRKRKWIGLTHDDHDVRGWFQWYARYWIGRRQPELDKIQIARWKSFVRHRGQILASYRRLGRNRPQTKAEKMKHRPRQRQALLQWGYNPFI